MEKKEKPQILKNYLSQKINPIFERLIIDLLIDMPSDVVSKLFCNITLRKWKKIKK